MHLSGEIISMPDGISILLVEYEASSDGFSIAVLTKHRATLVDTIIAAIEIDACISAAHKTDRFAEVISSTVFQKEKRRSLWTRLTGPRWSLFY